ncbi:putative nuclease HARBI1 [Nasonia vitripennis]|uniref:DDE Tnp4 domain-containing protein n=1 Tax=Nasonia vitripennis TaxID=7425 RepID=A0A7M7HEG8_NASVI|nr:putative nuclease HARBI1 [Nasonia vitripennis]
MGPIHMPVPTQERLFDIAQDFYLLWDLPHYVGAIDGRHVRIKRPNSSGSLYFNYKKLYSIVLPAIVDAKYKFICIDVGGYGHQHDATTLRNSTFYAALKDKTIELPEEDELPKSRKYLPYFFVGDRAYPIHTYLMKPLSRKKAFRCSIEL